MENGDGDGDGEMRKTRGALTRNGELGDKQRATVSLFGDGRGKVFGGHHNVAENENVIE